MRIFEYLRVERELKIARRECWESYFRGRGPLEEAIREAREENHEGN